MALVNCPECDSSISDQATSCPKCGFPLQGNRPGNGEGDKVSSAHESPTRSEITGNKPESSSETALGSVFIRFVTGRLGMLTSFWLVFVPVHLILVFGAAPLGRWVGRVGLNPKLMIMLFSVISLVAGVGAALSAWRTMRLPKWHKWAAISTFIMIVWFMGSYLHGAFRALWYL